MNRLDRITAILIQLQSRRIVKAQDIAERFEVSLRTIYRDVRTLEEAGVPLIGEAGIGYSLMDGYRLPPVMFTKEEATAFLTAEKMVEKLTDSSTQQSYQSAMFKVRAVLRTSEKNYLENVEDHIEVIGNRFLPNNQHELDYMQPMLRCITEKKVLDITYFANHNQANSIRRVEPVGIYLSNNFWYLIAYCQLRKDYRNFRLDRISEVIYTDLSFHQQHPPLKSFLTKISKEQSLTTVVLLVEKNMMRFMSNEKYYHGFVSEKEIGEQVEMTFLTASLYGFARWFMYFGDMADVVSPPELKEKVRDIMEKMFERLEKKTM